MSSYSSLTYLPTYPLTKYDIPTYSPTYPLTKYDIPTYSSSTSYIPSHIPSYLPTYPLTKYDTGLTTTVDRQNTMIDRMSDKVRSASISNINQRENMIVKNQQLYKQLQEKIAGKDRTIQKLEKELSSWQKVVDEVYRKYSNLRSNEVKKEYNMKRLQDEIKACKTQLDQAIKEKKIYASRMYDLERARKNAEHDYTHLYEVTEKLMRETPTISRRSSVIEEPYIPSVYVPTYTPTYTPSTYNTSYYESSYTTPTYYEGMYSSPTYYDTTYTTPTYRRKSVSDLSSCVRRSTGYTKIVLPQHIHALDLVDARKVYRGSWRCDLCTSEQNPNSNDSQHARYPYHCNIDNFDVCQHCVDKMEGAIVTDFFTYFK